MMGERENHDKDASSGTSRKKETPIPILGGIAILFNPIFQFI
jgi:hypothetical protein